MKGITVLITTCDVIPGRQIEVLGLALGNVVTSKHVGRDIMAGLKSVAGGEIKSYTDMMTEGREIAEQRMVAQAEAMGANAIICARFDSSSVMEGTQEMLAYGTAVRYL